MSQKNIENSLLKYLNGNANSEDLDILNAWIQMPENETMFKQYLKTHFAIYIGMNKPDSDKMKKRLLQEIRNDKQRIRKQQMQTYMKYAAVLIVILGIGFLLQDKFIPQPEQPAIVVNEDVITLEDAKGEVTVLEEDGNLIINDEKGKKVGEQKGQELVYTNTSKKEAKLVYNTLTIPYGKQLKVALSDGTKVMLNSGSTFKYPVNFIKGKKRKVFLQGEAFFDVAHDKAHPFIVEANSLDIEVLGTTFNVANYSEDLTTEVVLVDGSVKLEANKDPENTEHTILTPGHKGIFEKEAQNIETKEVNTSIYTAWTNGYVVFRELPFDNILKKLERFYNVKIINTNAELGKEKFNATIDVENEDIEMVLEYFNKLYDIQFEVINNEVVIQ